jgi:hypothetical protein
MKLMRIIFVLAVALWALPLGAQINRGILEGTVTDPAGAVVPGVEVTVTSVDSGIVATSKTNGVGYYLVPNLTPGLYRARFVTAGFPPLVLKDIAILAGKEIKLDAVLKLGATQQAIEVTANVAQIETTPTNYSTTVGSTLVNELPLAGRDIQQLVFLMPGVTAEAGPPGSTFGFNSQYGSWPDPTHLQGSALEVNGGSGGANAWYVDGSLNVSGIGENEVVNPSPDAVEQFQAVTSAFAAEYGHTAGGVFNVVLKSGTNAFHGDLYDYLRNSATNARNPFTSIDTTGHILPARVLHFNDAGGTLGGPVYIPHIYNGKNRTFFFFSYDESILHLQGAKTLTVPTAAMRRGDFSEVPNFAQLGIYNPYSTVGPDSEGNFARSAFGTPITPGGCTGSIVGGLAVNPKAATCNFSSQIPATIETPNGTVPGLNPIALYFLNSYPSPNYISPLSGCPMGAGGFPVCDNFLGTVGNSEVSQNLSLKIDHQWSDKNKFFGEWLYNPGAYRFYRVPWTGPSAPMSLVGYGGTYPMDSKSQVIAFGNTYMLSPTTINEFRASFSRQRIAASLGALNGIMKLSETEQELAPLQIPTQPQFYPVPYFSVSLPAGGSLGIGTQSWSDTYQVSEAYTFHDNVTLVRGKHTLKTGLMYRLEHGAWGGGVPTTLSFGGGTDENPITYLGGGGGLAELLMGAVPNGAGTGYQQPLYLRWRYWGAFFQDDFRVTPNFTLSLGLRYDLYGYAKNRIAQLQGKFCTSCVDPATGLPGQVLYPGQPGGIPLGHDYYPANKNDFAPRVNIAWTPFHDNKKTVIRAGYDVFYSDVTNETNNPGEGLGNTPGLFPVTSWNASYYPNQCASFTGACVAFPLLPSNVGVGTFATPPYTNTLPAYQKAPMLGSTLYQFVKPTRDPMVGRWDLEIERELPRNLFLSVGYVGEQATHLPTDFYRNIDYVPSSKRIQLRSSINNAIPITNYYSGTTAAALANIWGSDQLPQSILLTPYPAFSGLSQIPAFDANTSYNALNVRLQKRMSSGFTFIAAYTYSKKISSEKVTQAGVENSDPFHVSMANSIGSFLGGRTAVGIPYYASSYQNPDNRQGDRALAVDDIPQMFNFATTYELPFGKGKAFLNQGPWLNRAFGGWLLSGTFNAESGVPISVSGPCDQITCRPDLVGNPKAVTGGQNQAHWINPSAFAPPFGTDQNFWSNYDPSSPLAYQWGTAGAVIPGLFAPGFWNLDAALSKKFSVGESRYFQFRWELFNALNHQNLGYPNTGYCLPAGPNGETDLVRQAGCQFGRITNVQTDPRAMEFVLKFVF